jgi:hypothetical protein
MVGSSVRKKALYSQPHLAGFNAERAQYGRASGVDMPSGAFLDDADVNPVSPLRCTTPCSTTGRKKICAASTIARLMASSSWTCCPLWTRRDCPTMSKLGVAGRLHVPPGSQAARSHLRLLRRDRRACGAPRFAVSWYFELAVIKWRYAQRLCCFIPDLTINGRTEFKSKS